MSERLGVENRLVDFAVRVINFVDALQKKECDELIAIFVESIKTAEDNLENE